MIFTLFAIGLLSILSQVILLRELAVAFYGVELIYVFALAVWLIFSAAGALISRYRHVALGIMSAAFLCLAVLLPLSVIFIRAGRVLFGGVPGAYLTFSQQLLVPVLALLPIAFLTGMLFPLATAVYMRKSTAGGKSTARAYGIECTGALVGGLLSTLLLQWQFSVIGATLIFSAFISLIPLPYMGKGALSRRLFIIIACLFILSLFWASKLDTQTTGWNHPGLLESRETPYGRITVTGLNGQAAVFENDVLALETEGTEGEAFAHLTALQHPHPRRILLLGGGMEGLAEALRMHPVDKIDIVELNRSMVSMVTRRLSRERQLSLSTPPTHIYYHDPRKFLTQSGVYDLILVAMPDPASGQSNRFYTREFFQSCAARLRTGGIIGLRLRGAENIWPPPLRLRMASIEGALAAVFPHVLFLPGVSNIITASSAPLPEVSEVLIARWQSRQIIARLVTPSFIRYLFTNDRRQEIRKILRETKVPANSDIRPVCYRYTLQIWLSKFFPRASGSDFSRPVFFPWGILPLIVVAGFFLLVRSRPLARRLFLAGIAGFCAMVLQSVLILYYQVKEGVLYQDVGLLIACLMAGMALGAITLPRFLSAPSRRSGLALIGGFFVLALLIAVIIIDGSWGTGLLGMALLLIAVGLFAGAIFAYTTLSGAEDKLTPAISFLYAVDLLGGSMGAILGGMFLIPMLGLDIAVLFVASVVALAFIVV